LLVFNIYEYTRSENENEDIYLIKKLSIPEYPGDVLFSWIRRNLEEDVSDIFLFINGGDIARLLYNLAKVINESDIREKRMKAMYYFPIDYMIEFDHEILSDEYFDALNYLFTNLKSLSGVSSNDLNVHQAALISKNFVFTDNW